MLHINYKEKYLKYKKKYIELKQFGGNISRIIVDLIQYLNNNKIVPVTVTRVRAPDPTRYDDPIKKLITIQYEAGRVQQLTQEKINELIIIINKLDLDYTIKKNYFDRIKLLYPNTFLPTVINSSQTSQTYANNETREIQPIDGILFAQPSQIYQVRFPEKDIVVLVKNYTSTTIS